MAQLDKFKITALTWDSDKDPSGFYIWMENMSSLVRATAHGAPLEQMLDVKLRRPMVQAASIPSFILNDPDFAPINTTEPAAQPDDEEDEDLPDDASVSNFSLGSSGLRYSELSEDTRALDALLYNVLKINVKGSRNSLIPCVTFPSYVHAMCVLSKHMDISKTDRILRAIGAWDKLLFKGNVASYQTEVMSLKRELDASGANITHFMMGKIMRSFDGKSKTVQFKIAEDLNTRQIDETLNVYDLVQTYCADLASVGDGNSAKVGNVNIVCHECGESGHKRPDCPKLKAAKAKEKKKSDDKAKARAAKAKADKAKTEAIICHHCKEPGHKRPECPKLKAGLPAVGNASAPAAPVHNVGINQDQLQSLVNALRGGSNTNMVNVTPEIGVLSAQSDEAMHLSLCDGMGCYALSLKANRVKCTRYIGVEINPTSRIICDNANPADDLFPGVDHSWSTDVFKITEEMIRDLGHNAIKSFAAGPPCEDMSKLRLLPGYRKIKGEPRPGLKGKKGQVFVQTLQVFTWVLKYNPNCEHLIENLDFSDMDDWQVVCAVMGQPYVIDSADFSYTRRVRAWWTNIDLPSPD